MGTFKKKTNKKTHQICSSWKWLMTFNSRWVIQLMILKTIGMEAKCNPNWHHLIIVPLVGLTHFSLSNFFFSPQFTMTNFWTKSLYEILRHSRMHYFSLILCCRKCCYCALLGSALIFHTILSASQSLMNQFLNGLKI